MTIKGSLLQGIHRNQILPRLLPRGHPKTAAWTAHETVYRWTLFCQAMQAVLYVSCQEPLMQRHPS